MTTLAVRSAAAAVLLLIGCGPAATGDDTGPTPDAAAPLADAAPAADGRQDPPPPPTDGGGPMVDCRTLNATIRDFNKAQQPAGSAFPAHPDFEPNYTNDLPTTGLVLADLGQNGKPQFNPNGFFRGQIAGAASFAQWYADTDLSKSVAVPLTLSETTPGHYVYESHAFFPIDGAGWNEVSIVMGNVPHNFHFTTEIHTKFKYRGGEVFTFQGDDDLWLFINKRLAIDLGGIHREATFTVQLDTLGLTPNTEYSMDIFHAERHTDGSNFRMETTIECFTDPG